MVEVRFQARCRVVGSIAAILLSGSLAFGQGTGPCPSGFVDPPDGWYSGDTHDHIQRCALDPDVKVRELVLEMIDKGLDVSSPLIWSQAFITPDQYLLYADANITGDEHPATVGQPERVIQFGVEASGTSVSHMGHLIALNIRRPEADIFTLQLGCAPLFPALDWVNDGSGDYARPIFDLFRRAPRAVTGYAHQKWPVPYYLEASLGGWNWEDPSLPDYVGFDARRSFGKDLAFPIPESCGPFFPALGAIDAAMGRIDFLEAFNLSTPSPCDPQLMSMWYGMYYKLLSAGLQVSLGAGTDPWCNPPRCSPRVYAFLDPGEPLSYDAWTAALAAGRVSLATGSHQFLDLEVEGLPPGSQVVVDSPPSGPARVHVKATYQVQLDPPETVADRIEIVVDGTVVHSMRFGPLSSGSAVLETEIEVEESTWIAARTASGGAHTGAAYLALDGRPIAGPDAAEYWTLYCDFLNWFYDFMGWVGPDVLQHYTGCSEAEIREYIGDARRVFAALRDYALDPPSGVTRHGRPTPSSCAPPPGIVTADEPIASAPFTVRCFNAPPDSPGALLVSQVPGLAGPAFANAALDVTFPPVRVEPALSDEAGYAQVTFPRLPSIAPPELSMQFVWINPDGCDADGPFSASDSLHVVIRP